MLRLDYQALEVESNKLKAEGNTFEDCINTMTQIINALPDIWEAETCDQYLEQFTNARPTLMEVRQMIQDMALQMDSISRNFAQADSEMRSQMQ
jgi:WXG100 family type VII secretion target